jgi:hypothetical protein
MVEKKKILKKKLILNLLFLFLISIIFTFFYLFNNNQVNNEELSEKLFELSEINTIYIYRDSLRIQAEKLNNRWIIKSPINGRMSSNIIEKINYLNDFDSFEKVNINKNSIFTNSKASFTLKIDDLMFEFGNVNSIVNKQYLFFNDQVYLVPTFFSNNFSNDIITYIEKTIIPSKLKINKIEFINWIYSENSLYNKLDNSKKYVLPVEWKNLWTNTFSSLLTIEPIQFQTFIILEDSNNNKYKLFYNETSNSFLFKFQSETYIYKLSKESTLRLLEPWTFLNARTS